MLACPICRSKKLHIFYRKTNNLFICSSCRHIFWDKILNKNELEDFYTNKYNPLHNQIDIQTTNRDYYISHINALVNYRNIVRKHATIMDYGCSFPILAIEANRQGFKNVIGVELDKNCIQYGIENGIQMITPDDVSHSIKNGSIDIVRFSHILEHIIELVETLKTIVKKMKHHGLIYITQPNFPVFQVKEMTTSIKDSVYPEHLHFFSPLSLVTLVSRCGLLIKKFFTHQNADDVLKRYALDIDFNKAAKELSRLSDLGDIGYGLNANYPVYCGENSILYAELG